MSEVEATANLAEGPSPAEVAIEALDAALREQFGSAPSGAIGERRQRHESPEWDVAPHAIAEVCAWLKAEHGLNNLALLSTVDRLTHLDLVYLLDAMPVPPPYTRLWLRCRLERDVELPTIPTVCGVWRSANWQEREAFDLMGIRFEGHPDLRRILLPDCWEGYPLRKDYRYDSNTMVDAILTAELGPGEYRRPQGG